jgi:SNF2 family DNA or RNA helicase
MFPLMDHQRRAVEKLSRIKVGALFMDMRTGKSRTAMELAVPRLMTGRAKRVVWFCPTDSMETIAEEVEKHLPGSSVHVMGDKTKPGTIPEATWYIVGLEGLSSSLRIFQVCRELTNGAFVIVDEAGMCANHRAIRTRRLMQMAEKMPYRLILDGTPIGNGIEDLYAPITWLSPKILGYWSYRQFAVRHLEFSDEPGRRRRVTHRKNIGVITAKIAPYVFQVRREECFDLPKETWSEEHFSMTNWQRTIYEEAKKRILCHVEAFDWGDATIYRLFSALQRIACGFMWNWRSIVQMDNDTLEPGASLFDDIETNPRAQLLLRVAERIEPDRQVLVWCKYAGCVDTAAATLRARFGADAVETYDGRVGDADRTERRQRFQAGGFRWLVLNQATAARALDLSAANYHIHYSTTFKGRDRRQCEARTQAPTQKHSVAHIDLVARDSIEGMIQRCLGNKQDAAKTFRDQLAVIRAEKSKRKAEAMLKQFMGTI